MLAVSHNDTFLSPRGWWRFNPNQSERGFSRAPVLPWLGALVLKTGLRVWDRAMCETGLRVWDRAPCETQGPSQHNRTRVDALRAFLQPRHEDPKHTHGSTGARGKQAVFCVCSATRPRWGQPLALVIPPQQHSSRTPCSRREPTAAVPFRSSLTLGSGGQREMRCDLLMFFLFLFVCFYMAWKTMFRFVFCPPGTFKLSQKNLIILRFLKILMEHIFFTPHTVSNYVLAL